MPVLPRSLREFLPAPGWAGNLFNTRHMPTEAKISYIVNVILLIIGLVFAAFGMLFIIPLIIAGFAAGGSAGAIGIGLVLVALVVLAISLALSVISVIALLKVREQQNWARWLLLLSVVLGIITNLIPDGSEGGSNPVQGGSIAVSTVFSLVLIALLFLPRANAWFQAKDDEKRAERAAANRTA